MNNFNNDDFYIYYLRRDDNTPIGCVALRQDSVGNWARGISLCSTQDQFSKDKAKKLAKRRCIDALFTQQSTEPIKASDKEVIRYDAGSWYTSCKSDYGSHLTTKEQEIVRGNDKPIFVRN